jgi:hypothetical protein
MAKSESERITDLERRVRSLECSVSEYMELLGSALKARLDDGTRPNLRLVEGNQSDRMKSHKD